MTTVLVRGSGDVGSAVAHLLFREGFAVIVHDRARPSHPRRGMAVCDALYEGNVTLAGLLAKRARDPADAIPMLGCRRAIPVTDGDLAELAQAVRPAVLVDARMRKRAVPEAQSGLAPLTIGLGPNFTASKNVDIAIETGWGESLGQPIYAGSTRSLAGDPKPLGGHSRDRFVYSPTAGLFTTSKTIGNRVEAGEVVALVGEVAIHAPMSGILRGISHDGAEVEARAKIVEVDPTNGNASAFGLGERPLRIAQGVLQAIRSRQ